MDMMTDIPPDLHSAVIRFGGYVFLPQKRRLCFNSQTVALTEKENGLLALFCRFANRLLPRSYALVSLWRHNTYFNSRSMDVYVSRLRKILAADPEVAIMNVHGKGFKLLVPGIEFGSPAESQPHPASPKGRGSVGR